MEERKDNLEVNESQVNESQETGAQVMEPQVTDSQVEEPQAEEAKTTSSESSQSSDSVWPVLSGCGCLILAAPVFLFLYGAMSMPGSAFFTWVISKWTDKSFGRTYELLVDKMISWSWMGAKVIGAIVAIVLLISLIIWISNQFKKKDS